MHSGRHVDGNSTTESRRTESSRFTPFRKRFHAERVPTGALPTAVRKLSRHVQCSPHRIGKRACYAHRIILLKTRDRIGYLCRKYPVDRATIVAEPGQR